GRCRGNTMRSSTCAGMRRPDAVCGLESARRNTRRDQAHVNQECIEERTTPCRPGTGRRPWCQPQESCAGKCEPSVRLYRHGECRNESARVETRAYGLDVAVEPERFRQEQTRGHSQNV